jgi:hypothetical protein
MVKPDAKVIARIMFGTLSCGFFRVGDKDAGIYFSIPHGKESFHFPVLEDGTVSDSGEPFPEDSYPSKMIDIIDFFEVVPELKHLRWASGNLVFA